MVKKIDFGEALDEEDNQQKRKELRRNQEEFFG